MKIKDQLLKFADCCYCGDIATCLDHVVPVSYSQKSGTRINDLTSEEKIKKLTVGCCTECNSLLSNHMFDSIASRAEYLSDQVAKRHKKLLKSPAWTDEELEELEGSLKVRVMAKQKLKELTIERLRHLNHMRFMSNFTIQDYWDSQEGT